MQLILRLNFTTRTPTLASRRRRRLLQLRSAHATSSVDASITSSERRAKAGGLTPAVPKALEPIGLLDLIASDTNVQTPEALRSPATLIILAARHSRYRDALRLPRRQNHSRQKPLNRLAQRCFHHNSGNKSARAFWTISERQTRRHGPLVVCQTARTISYRRWWHSSTVNDARSLTSLCIADLAERPTRHPQQYDTHPRTRRHFSKAVLYLLSLGFATSSSLRPKIPDVTQYPNTVANHPTLTLYLYK